MNKSLVYAGLNGGVNSHLAQIAQTPDTTANRPTDVFAGCMYYDTTLHKPIWLKSKTPDVWTDAAGTTV